MLSNILFSTIRKKFDLNHHKKQPDLNHDLKDDLYHDLNHLNFYASP